MLILPQNSPEHTSAGADISQRIAIVRAAIAQTESAAGRSVDSVTLLAVSKGQRADVVQQAAQAGLRHFGENYASEAIAKMDAVAALGGMEGLTWHFIGRVQGNKTREIATRFAWVHGVDRLRIAQRLSAQRAGAVTPLNVCVQVNVAGEASKGGVTPAEVAPLLQAVAQLPNLRLRGLMCILPFEMTEPAAQRAAFDQLRELLHAAPGPELALDTLSMGMSADFAPAIAAGATIVRIGTALFGPRYTDGAAAP